MKKLKQYLVQVRTERVEQDLFQITRTYESLFHGFKFDIMYFGLWGKRNAGVHDWFEVVTW